MWHTQSCNWKKGSTLSSIMMRCHCNQWAMQVALAGWRATATPKEGEWTLCSCLRLHSGDHGASLSHTDTAWGSSSTPDWQPPSKDGMQNNYLPRQKCWCLVGYGTAAHAESKTPSRFLNTCTQELLASGCLIASLAHEALANDALNIKNMNIKAGGKQRSLHPTIIPVSNPPPKPGKCDTVVTSKIFIPTDHPNADFRASQKEFVAIVMECTSVWDALCEASGSERQVKNICSMCKASQVEKDRLARVASYGMYWGQCDSGWWTLGVPKATHRYCLHNWHSLTTARLSRWETIHTNLFRNTGTHLYVFTEVPLQIGPYRDVLGMG